MNYADASIIVIGSLNTDIVALEVDELLGTGELTRSGRLYIGPGGKSRNMAQMIAALMGKDRVAMIGRTSRDHYRLWEIPMNALESAGVITDYIKILDYSATGEYPGVALIPVNKNGENQIYVLPGISNTFCPDDIDRATLLFETVAKNKGILTMSLEQPLDTAIYAVKKARSMGIRIVLDPGGTDRTSDYEELLSLGLFAIKPNEHEAYMLTRIEVIDSESARACADILLSKGIENVIITLGGRGAYLFNVSASMHLDVPKLKQTGSRDETGCGDQVTAVLCAELVQGKDVVEATRTAIYAGTMQYLRSGIKPVTTEELNSMPQGV